MRIDVHNHFIPGLDDGCKNLAESFACLRMMAEAGYSKVFCTPHSGSTEFTDLTVAQVATAVDDLRNAIALEKIPMDLLPGGELRLTPDLPEHMREVGIPTYGHFNKYVIADIWEPAWPAWATRAVEWLQRQNLTVILAHPERMAYLRKNAANVEELKALGLLFQGNLGPIGGYDSPDVVALAEKFLKEGLYFLLGTDGHRPDTLPPRIRGLQRAAELVGTQTVDLLTITNPGKLWTPAP